MKAKALNTRITTIVDAINGYKPQAFADKPYQATYEVIGGVVKIVCKSTETTEELRTYTLSDHDHWPAETVAEDMVTELNEIIDNQ